MNRCKSILVVVLGIVVIGIAGACTDGPRPTATPTPAPLVIDLAGLVDANKVNLSPLVYSPWALPLNPQLG